MLDSETLKFLLGVSLQFVSMPYLDAPEKLYNVASLVLAISLFVVLGGILGKFCQLVETKEETENRNFENTIALVENNRKHLVVTRNLFAISWA